MNCKIFQNEMPGLLTAPAEPRASVANSAARTHLATCPSCQQEFASFQGTFNLLDAWQAPEPSAYFDQKFAVRLREEQANPPANWFERMQARLLFNTGRQFRPALAGTIALALLIGGGTFAGVSSFPAHPAPAQVSATVDDLQILDRNAQAIQQMDQLLQDDQPADDASGPPRT